MRGIWTKLETDPRKGIGTERGTVPQREIGLMKEMGPRKKHEEREEH